MPDSNRVLPDSFGLPLCWIYNGAGGHILMEDNYGQQTNVNQMVTKFKYKYDEENDDECNITIRVANSRQLNNPEFRTDNRLLVQWGYLLPNGKLLKSPMRKVAIRDIESSYKADAIEIELVCTDLISYIKNQRTNTVSDSDNFVDWINEIITGKYIYTHTIKGKVHVMNKSKDRVEIDKLIVKPETGNKRFEKEIMVRDNLTRNQSFRRNDNTEVYDGTKQLYLGKDPDMVIKGRGNAIANETKRILNEHPDGPAYLEGRDDVLNVLVRDWNQAPSAVYTYAGSSGELIEFKPKTNVQKTDDDMIESTQVNPETKKVETTRAVNSMIDFGELPDNVSKLQAIEVESKARMIFQFNATHPLNHINMSDHITFKETYLSDEYANKANVMGTTRVNLGRKLLNKEYSVATKSILNSPYLNKKRNELIMQNFIKKKIERKFEASGKIIGDPSAICGKVHMIKGLSKVDNGNWYVTTVTHELTPESGYTCDMIYLKKPKLIRTLLERRESTPGEEAPAPPSEEIQEVAYLDLPPTSTSGFSLDNISERLAAQKLHEETYLNDNDVLFDTKKQLNQFKPDINSMDT